MRRSTAILSIVFFGLLACALAMWRNHHEREAGLSPRERALAECRLCGLGDEEIERLIRTMAGSDRDLAALLEKFHATFQPGDTHRELCKPCAEAVLDAAGVKPTEIVKADRSKYDVHLWHGRNQSITELRRALEELGFRVTLFSKRHSENAQDVRFDLPREIDDDVVRLIVSTTLKYFQLPVFVYQDMERENSEVHVGLASGDPRDTVPYAKVIEILNSESGGVAEQLVAAMKK